LSALVDLSADKAPRDKVEELPYRSSRSGGESITHTRSSSVWTAPSPSQAFDPSSSWLPSLPSQPDLPRHSHNLLSPATHQRSDSSTYYTAPWGSPSESLLSPEVLPGRHKQRKVSLVTADGSPLRRARPKILERVFTPQSQRGTPIAERESQARPSETHNKSVVEFISPLAQRKSRYGLTEDWLKNNILSLQRSERSNWWSDDTDASDTPSVGVSNHLANSPPDEGWLALDRKTRQYQSTEFLQGSSSISTEKIPGYSLLRVSKGSLLAAMPVSAFESPIISPSQGLNNRIQNVGKPLPPSPPSEEIINSLAVSHTGFTAIELSTNTRPPVSTVNSFQRPKKRVPWRGKTCIIALPLGDDHGDTISQNTYLSPEAVSERLREWERNGYDTRGFGISPVFAGTTLPPFSEGQSRLPYPDPEDEKREGTGVPYRVSIPDRREWETYVNRLKEEKLRALGVSFGDEEPPRRESPVISLMSRQASSQSTAVAMSPSLALSSAASSQAPQYMSPFSPSYYTSPNPSSHVSSVASPVSQYPEKPRVPHFPRYSVALPSGENGYPSPYQFAQTSTISSTRSPQQQLSSPPQLSDVSPAANQHIPSLGAARSPVPPYVRTNSQQAVNQGSSSLLAQMRQQQNRLEAQQQQQLYMQSLPPVAKLYNFAEQSRATKYEQPEIATPVPRGHRQNLSETLQREVDEAESHLEASMSRLEEASGKLLDSNVRREDSKSEDLPVLFSKSPRADGSDIDTNPSIAGTPPLSKSRLGLGHASKPSASKLNVNAPVFTLEPKLSYAPDVFAFLGNESTIPSGRGSSLVNPDVNHTKQQSDGSVHDSGLNVSAPAFTPSNTTKPIVPSREFSFSSIGPTFKPDAPSFTPSNPTAAPGSKVSGSDVPDNAVKKIFHMNFSEVIKPAKWSKAIPIVKPTESQSESDRNADGQEDESGRITQADGRQKRARRHDGDGDQVPQFATPSGILPSEPVEAASPGVGTSSAATPNNEREVKTMENAASSLKEIIGGLPASEIISPTGSHQSVDADGKHWEPFAFPDAEEAAIFNAARPSSPEQSRGKLDLDTVETTKKEIKDTARLELAPSEYPDANMLTASNAFSSPRQTSSPTILDRLGIQPDLSASDSEGASRVVDDDLVDSRSVSSRSASFDLPEGHVERFHEQFPDSRTSPIRRSPRPDQDLVENIVEGVTYIEPSYQEIDAVMKHLNEEDSDLGVERSGGPWGPRNTLRTPLAEVHENSRTHQFLPATHIRSDAPSPSPRRLQQTYQYPPRTDSDSADSAEVAMVARNARFSPSYRPSKSETVDLSPIHRLNSPGNVPISDWDDAFSSVDDDLKLRSRTGFFDSRIDDLVGGIVQQRLGPLEKTLAGIQDSLVILSSRSANRRRRRSFSGEIVHSDADDEDDEDDPEDPSQQRLRSPVRDRKYEKLKAALSEVTAAQQKFAPVSEFTEVMEAVKDLKASLQQAPQAVGDIKAIIEEAVGRQMRGRSVPITSSSLSATAEKAQLQIAGLESMLKVAETRAEDELKARRSTEDALADAQRLLRQALYEAAEQRESAEETERSLATFHEERQQVLKRAAMLEGSQESMQKTASDLSEKNTALEDTLEEYRLSHTQWRKEMEESKTENKDLRRTINALKAEIEDSIRGRHTLRAKLDRLQEDMTQASRDIAHDQAVWRNREEDQRARLDLLSTKLEAEARTRERPEREVERLEALETETFRLRLSAEETGSANARLQALVEELSRENEKHQVKATSMERDLDDAKESGRLEVQRTRTAMDANIEAANIKAENVRADLQAVITRLQSQLDVAAEDAGKAKARHELMLEEASDFRNDALREAAEAREAALQEHYRFHERTLEEMTSQHERALGNALEDKGRSETHLNDCLVLANEKVLHYQQRVTHLEEKLQIAKSAAHAAVQAAQSQKGTPSPSAGRASMPFTKGSDIPEKISPQALRESVMVLQEQLQEREGRIEKIEQELSNVDKDAPAKIKDQEAEITWLRELLGVRVDDLEDLISILSQPSYDREAVKDATIRLKANLQMEQQEKERALAGGKTFPSLSSLSNLAASPRALPLAAAAAWGNWRKGRDTSFGNLSAIANGSVNQTPSRSSPSQSFLSGLMTPPSTNFRQTPQQGSSIGLPRPTSSAFGSARPYRTPRQSLSLQDENRPLKDVGPPTTPPLMRKASYDEDASSSGFGDTFPEAGKAAEEEPFGPTIGSRSELT